MKRFDAELLPFAPMLYVAWADRSLGPAEIAQVRARAAADERLDSRTRAALDAWLDPASPPGATDLCTLLEVVRARGQRLPVEARSSLAALGAAIAAVGDRDALPTPQTRAALAELEDALGIVSMEAARALLPPGYAAAPIAPPPPPFDPLAMHRLLDHDNLDLRDTLLALLSGPDFALLPHDTDAHTYRQQVLVWCRRLADLGFSAIPFPHEFGGLDDVARSIAVFETIAYHDLSLLVKFGVQFGLFAGSIFQLGTRSHHERYLRAAIRLELPGCFAMTETAHGSNVRGLETTATYDVAAREFVLRTPHADAAKDYIGNAALHARMAVVFAQLHTGEEAHGVHALLVPIRDQNGRALDGVRIEDCGTKAGLNGVDNGRLWFDNVRVPRENLLNRFGDVAEDGAYSSPIRSPGRRFFTMIGTLVAGRITIAAAAMNAGKVSLTIATRYADRRHQFGPEAEAEVPVLDYLATQRRLLPAVATTYALDFALKDLIRSFAQAESGAAREIEGLAAGLKAFSSTHTVRTVQAAREACGGQGYLAVNRLPALKADTDVFTTFEGANPVLLQLLARALLTDYREEFGELRIWGILRHVARRAAARIAGLNPIVTRRTDQDHLRDPAFHSAAFRYREERLLTSLARRLRRRIEAGVDSFDALNACQDHALALANAHIERILLERFQSAVASCSDDTLMPVLAQLAALFALWTLDREAGWYLEKGYIEPPKARAIRRQVNELCTEIRPAAVALVDAFGIPDPLVGAPIARA